MAQREKCRQVEGQSVFDRMTNPSGFTGAHAARFGVVDGKQSSVPAQTTPKQEIKKQPPQETRSMKEKCQPVAGQSVYDRMTNPSGYTGAHAARFGIDAEKSTTAREAKILDARPKIEQHPHPAGASQREKCREVQGGSVYDRLTNPQGYTGAHAARFDSSGRGVGGERIAKGGPDPSGLQNMLRK